MLRDALRQLPDVRPGTRPGRKVLVRTDAAGCTHAVLNWLHAQRLSYSVGFPLPDTAPDLVARIPDNAWTPAYDSDAAVRPGAWVAELTGLLVCHEQLDLAGDLRRGEHPEPVQPEQHCRRATVSIHLEPLVSVYLSSRIVRPQACLHAQDKNRVPERNHDHGEELIIGALKRIAAGRPRTVAESEDLRAALVHPGRRAGRN